MENNYEGYATQKPIGSGFFAGSTTNDVMKGISLTGKKAVVTGGYAGLGLETVKTFVNAGAEVIVPARDRAKAESNLRDLPNVKVITMDLMDPDSIDSFADQFLAEHQALDILVNNAGVMWVPLQRDSRGYESQLSINYLGHFQLTARLWPGLKNAGQARVINVSSRGHRYADFNFDDPNFEHTEYETLKGYGQSKTANILFTVELDHRGKSYGVRSFSLHPGVIVDTDMKRLLTQRQLLEMGIIDANGHTLYYAEKGLKTIPQGASTTAWCATNPMLTGLGGVYCEDNEVANIYNPATASNNSDAPPFTGVMPYAIDPEHANQLWSLSEKLTSITFNI